MKYKSILSILSSLLTIGFSSSHAQAQSAFAGFYGQVSTGYESNQLGSMSGSSTTTPNASSNTNRSASSQVFGAAPLVLGAGYYWQTNDKWLIGLGADYSVLSQTSSNITVTNTNAAGNTSIPAGETATTSGTSLQLSNRFNLFLTPAYAIDQEKFIYLKAGYSQLATQYNRATSATSTLNGKSRSSAASGGNQTSNLGGYLFGLGYKQMITSGLYGFVEGNYMGYSAPSYSYNSPAKSGEAINGISSTGTRTISTNFANLNTYQLLVGLGYAF
jgi:hypothetical protein